MITLFDAEEMSRRCESQSNFGMKREWSERSLVAGTIVEEVIIGIAVNGSPTSIQVLRLRVAAFWILIIGSSYV